VAPVRSSEVPSRSSWLAGVLVLVAVVVVGRGLGEGRRFAELLRHAEPGWIAVLGLLQIATYLVLAVTWRAALRHADVAPPRYPILVRLALAELFVDQAAPTGGVGGSVLVVRALVRRGVPRRAAIDTVVASLFGYYAAALVAVPSAALIFLFRERFVHFAIVVALLAFAVAVALPLVVLAVVAGALPRLPRRVRASRIVRLLGRAIGSARPERFLERTLLLPIALLRLAILTLDGLSLAAASAAFGHPIDADVCIAVFVLASVAGSLSFVPGALGTFEALAVGLFAVFAVPVELAVAAVLLHRGFSFWLPMLPGLWLARAELRAGSLQDEAS
jgi:hypothetical protein